MEKLRIETTDIYLDDTKPGSGKITVSDSWHGAYTYYWGAMGSDDLAGFLMRINGEYFADKLSTKREQFDAKASARAIRKYIKTDCSYEMPWYKWMSGQKELREKIRELESCSSEDDFMYCCRNIHSSLLCLDMKWEEEREFTELIKAIFSEPWQFLETKESRQFKWLKDLLGKIQTELQKTQLAEAS